MSELCLAQVDAQNPIHESLTLIHESAQQASLLLQRLSRLIYEVPGAATYHDLNSIISETADIIRRMLARNIEIVIELNPRPLPVFVDAVALRRVIIYLALNAAARVAKHGKLILATKEVEPAGEAPESVLARFTISNVATPAAIETMDERSEQRSRLAEAFARAHSGSIATSGTPPTIVDLSLPRAVLD